MVRHVLWLWDRLFGDGLRKVEADSLAYRLSQAGRGPDWKTVIVLLTAAICLTIQNYGLSPERVTPVVRFVVELIEGPEAGKQVAATLRDWTLDQKTCMTWAALTMILSYTILPLLAITLLFRDRIRDYGTLIRPAPDEWAVAFGFALIMLPLVWLFSTEDRFQATYPMYRLYSRTDIGDGFYRWEVLYALQFVALEFFFRGFLVHGTKHRFGVYSVFVMCVPYCMLHYGKPMPEAVGSIIAGMALGIVSLVYRSVWPGALLHITVAWGMDASCLYRRGLIG